MAPVRSSEGFGRTNAATPRAPRVGGSGVGGLAYDRLVRFGVVLIPTDPWDETIAVAERIEALGYHHLWVYDHLSWRRYRERPWHATYPWLTGIAAHTERIRLGTMVSNLNVRHPVTLAKDAMTIDHISAGRFTLGLGAGGVGFDATVLGQAELTPAERVDRLAEAAPLLDGLLRDTVRNHDGAWYQVDEARMLPGCVQRPRLPIAIAAGGARALRVAAAHGDAWITLGDTGGGILSADRADGFVADQSRRLDRLCAAIDRDPASLDRIHLVGATEARPLASLSTFEAFVERCERIGFTDIVFHHPRRDDQAWDDPPEIVEQIASALL